MIKSKTRTLAGVMLRSGSTYREVSDALEISVGSVHNISREDMDYLQPLVMEMKRRSAYKCYLLADHTLSRMSDADFERADLKQKSIAAGILFDKATMLEGVMPGPDESGWDESRPGEMGRLYWPQRKKDALPKNELQVLLMSLFMQGRDSDARRIGRIAGMKRKDIEECQYWEDLFDEPTTVEEAWQWMDEGKLRKDYDTSRLPWDEEEKNAREIAEHRERVVERFEEETGMKNSFAKDTDGGEDSAEASADETGLAAVTTMPKLGMEKVMDGELKAKSELNRIEQAVQAQLDEKYGKTPGQGNKN